MTGRYDYIVVGGGIVGVATARALLKQTPGCGILLVDKEPTLGRHQTSHNSGVIHSGIYYEPNSLKSRLCRQGARATKEFAAEHEIPVERSGKLLVATNRREVAAMAHLKARAEHNGIEAEVIDAAELRRREPAVVGLGALWLAETSVTDYAQITDALARNFQAEGGEIRTGVLVSGVSETTDEVRLTTGQGQLRARQVVFCGGLQADRLARLAGLQADLAILPFRGEYYDVVPHRAGLVSALVYPIPDPALPFLGIHLTPTVHGGLQVGPNAVLGLAREGYPKFSVDRRDLTELIGYRGTWALALSNVRTGARELANSLSKRSYLRACRRYCPSLELADLVSGEAGIRAQAVRPDGSLVHDFWLRQTPRTLHVLNAPSPAATSAPAIAMVLASRLVASGPLS